VQQFRDRGKIALTFGMCGCVQLLVSGVEDGRKIRGMFTLIQIKVFIPSYSLCQKHN
jgi:hypothetical protein